MKLVPAVSNEDFEITFKDEKNCNAFAEKKVSGIEFHVPQDKRDDLVKEIQGKLGNKYVVYFSKRNFGFGPDEITILSTSDKFDALYFEGTNGINFDITVEDIVENLKDLETENPFVLTGVGFDFVHGDFLKPLTNIRQLSEKMYEFCPDIVDQGTGSAEGLANELKRTNSFFYWWD